MLKNKKKVESRYMQCIEADDVAVGKIITIEDKIGKFIVLEITRAQRVRAESLFDKHIVSVLPRNCKVCKEK